jgi:hypothetical protein
VHRRTALTRGLARFEFWKKVVSLTLIAPRPSHSAEARAGAYIVFQLNSQARMKNNLCVKPGGSPPSIALAPARGASALDERTPNP